MTFTNRFTRLLLAGVLGCTLAACGSTETATGSTAGEEEISTTPETTEEFVYVKPEENGYLDGISYQKLVDAFTEKYPDILLYGNYDTISLILPEEGAESLYDYDTGKMNAVFEIEMTPYGEDQISDIHWAAYSEDIDSLDFLIDQLDLRDKVMIKSWFADDRPADTLPFDEWYEYATSEEGAGHIGTTGDLDISISLVDESADEYSFSSASISCRDEMEPVMGSGSTHLLKLYVEDKYGRFEDISLQNLEIEGNAMTITIKSEPSFEEFLADEAYLLYVKDMFLDEANTIVDHAEYIYVDLSTVTFRLLSTDGSDVLLETTYPDDVTEEETE